MFLSREVCRESQNGHLAEFCECEGSGGERGGLLSPTKTPTGQRKPRPYNSFLNPELQARKQWAGSQGPGAQQLGPGKSTGPALIQILPVSHGDSLVFQSIPYRVKNSNQFPTPE